MFMKFKRNQQVLINGIGKFEDTIYKNKLATVIRRDPYFKDFYVRFEDGTADWISPEHIKPIIEQNNRKDENHEN